MCALVALTRGVGAGQARVAAEHAPFNPLVQGSTPWRPTCSASPTRYSRSVHKRKREAIMALRECTHRRSIRPFEGVSITPRGIRIWAVFRTGTYLRTGRPKRMTRSR